MPFYCSDIIVILMGSLPERVVMEYMKLIHFYTLDQFMLKGKMKREGIRDNGYLPH